MKRLIVTLAMAAWSLTGAWAAEPNPRADEEAAIRKAVESYVAAFNKSDAKALAAAWSAEAVYTNPQSGAQVVGREAIEKQFASIFADSKGITLEATTHSIDFISPSVAVEQGSAKLMEAEQTVEESDYSAVYVKRDGKWLLDRVTEEEVFQAPSHFEQLKDLDWLVGRWTDKDDQATVTTDCNWSRNANFLVRTFAVEIGDNIDMSGIQFIGWDPSTKQIRSWVFDSDGGFGQGVWSKKDNRWSVQQTGVLPDGSKSSAVNVITHIDDSTMTLQSVSRTLDGEILPNIDEVKVTKE